MNPTGPNGIAGAEEFRAAAAIAREKRAEIVLLPSGLRARLVRFSPLEATLYLGQLPQGVAARIAPEQEGVVSPEQLVRMAQQVVEAVRFVFVEPRVPDELKPGNDIAVSDIEYALSWSRGEIAADGRDLAAFRGPAGERAAAAGADGGDVPLPPERAPAGRPEPLPD